MTTTVTIPTLNALNVPSLIVDASQRSKTPNVKNMEVNQNVELHIAERSRKNEVFADFIIICFIINNNSDSKKKKKQ